MDYKEVMGIDPTHTKAANALYKIDPKLILPPEG